MIGTEFLLEVSSNDRRPLVPLVPIFVPLVPIVVPLVILRVLTRLIHNHHAFVTEFYYLLKTPSR